MSILAILIFSGNIVRTTCVS